MSRLIPEKRINKNGVAVTKHVRADPRKGAGSALPVPTVVKSGVRKAAPALDEALELTRALQDTHGQQRLPFTLDDLDPQAIEELESLLVADNERRPRSYVISSGITTALSQDTVEDCVAYMHNIAVFGSLIAGPDSNSITGFLNGLEKYPETILPATKDYLLDATGEQVDKVHGLLEFTLRANQIDSPALVYDSFLENLGSFDPNDSIYVKLIDDDLAACVMDHPDHHEAILEMMKREGKSLPAEVIKGRLNHDVQSLREGFL